MKIYFDKLYRYDRLQEPAGIALPFKEGELKSADRIAITQNGRKCMVQPKVTSKHADGSIRYLYVDFLADIPANKGAVLEFEKESEGSCEGKGVSVTQTEQGLCVDTGCVTFTVKNNSQNIFETLDDGRKHYTAQNFEGPYLKDDMGLYDINIGEWKIIDAGPVKCVIRAKGSNILNNKKVDFEITLTSYAAKSWIDVSYRIINTTYDELHIKSLVFYAKPDETVTASDDLFDMHINMDNDSTGCGDVLTDNSKENGPVYHTRGTGELEMISGKAPVSNVRTLVGSSNYKTDFYIGRDGVQVNKIIDDAYLVKEANEHFAEVFYGTFLADYTDGNDGLCITVYQAQQNYPKAVKAYDGGVAVMLVPEDIGNVVMQSGMAKEQRFLMHFHEPDMQMWEIDNRSTIYQMPDRPCIAPEEFKKADVCMDVFPEHLVDEVEIALIARADNHSRCYGMLNWGDSIDMGYTLQGRGGGKPVWSNNEYDYPHSCALMYARTGIRRFLDYLIVSAKHQMDVDVCHYSKNPLRIGGQWEHTAGHCKNGIMVCSHEWVEGVIDYYHFTGDERGLETAISIGDNILRLLDTPMYAKPGEANARETGWALRALVALYVETRDEKWLAKCEWIIDSFKIWEEEYGNWLAPYTDNTLIRVGFMISVAAGSVMRYYRVFPREDIKQMLIRAIDDIVENCTLDNGLFYYKELPSLSRNGNNTLLLESLAIAYELTGDKKYLEYGFKTFETNINNTGRAGVGSKKVIDDAVVVSGDSTKGFAQSFIPLVTYYKALGDTGLINNVKLYS